MYLIFFEILTYSTLPCNG